MNTFGRLFRVSIFGESHGQIVGVCLDGIPPGIPIDKDDFKNDINRRKPGKKGTTPRVESDLPLIKSGVFNGFTSGAPLLIEFENNNVRSKDYSSVKETPRPGHSDFVASKKYGGFNDYRGGGHFSGRLTLGIVAAGVLAKKILGEIKVNAQLTEAGGSQDIDKSIDAALKSGDSIGGIVECRLTNIPIGLGEPFFDSVESQLAHAVFAIPAIKGVEFGSGFDASKMKGSQHNDLIENETGKTITNYSGGINGGITNGNDVVFRIAVKPTSSISKPQETFNFEKGEKTKLEIKGRHDACIALRVPVVLEAIAAIVFADLLLVQLNKKIEL